jgi:phage head maturation protease
VWLRNVKRITGLYDVAIVTHPAYEQTDVATREESEAIDKAIEAQLKRECGDDEAKKKAEEEAKAEEERKAAEEAAKREAEANAKEEEEQRQLEEQEQRFREQQAMRMCAKARMLNEEILNSLEY